MTQLPRHFDDLAADMQEAVVILSGMQHKAAKAAYFDAGREGRLANTNGTAGDIAAAILAQRLDYLRLTLAEPAAPLPTFESPRAAARKARKGCRC